MLVKITRCSSPRFWYADQIGEVVDVYDDRDSDGDYTVRGGTHTDNYIQSQDCLVLLPSMATLKSELQALTERIRILEEEERNKFTQEDYERIVAQLRACQGRVAYNRDTYYMELVDGSLETDKSGGYQWGLFQVYFEDASSVRQAIREVGEENIIKALKFEQEIGL